jgi:hypothetical protein
MVRLRRVCVWVQGVANKIPLIELVVDVLFFSFFFGIAFGPPNSQKKKREKILAEASVGSLLL